MNVLSNTELNKLRNVEATIEKFLKNVLEKLKYIPQFTLDFMDSFETSNKSEDQEINKLKTEIQNITISLHVKLDVFKCNKIDEIRDMKKFKQEMIEIQDNISNIKSKSKAELNKLFKMEDDLNDELNIYYNGKLAEWNEPIHVNINCEYVSAKIKSKAPGPCKEVQEFFDFVHQSGGPENGWRKEDHHLFVKFRSKYKKVDTLAFHLHEVFPDISIEEIKSHEEWYRKYLHLQSKKKEAINKWKLNKNNKSVNRNEVEISVESRKIQENGSKLREKLLQWKTEKEERLLREKEFEKQKMLDKLEKERMEKQKQLEIKYIVNEWKESKEALEETRKQNKLMYEEMEKRRRAVLANKLIKQFQSMDTEHIAKMRRLHKKIIVEPKRVQSGPIVLRDPKRLLKPTAQWSHRVTALRDSINRPISLSAAPKLAIPAWRKGIM